MTRHVLRRWVNGAVHPSVQQHRNFVRLTLDDEGGYSCVMKRVVAQGAGSRAAGVVCSADRRQNALPNVANVRPRSNRKININRQVVGASVNRRRKIETTDGCRYNFGMRQKRGDSIGSSNSAYSSCRVSRPNNKIG